MNFIFNEKRVYILMRFEYSLLLAAFCVTLILDMGGGPVFIVYASLHLNKNASFPAATWLLVSFFGSFLV